MTNENIEYLQETIARRAYELSQLRNGAGSDPLGDWLQAEQEVLATRNGSAAPAPEATSAATQLPATDIPSEPQKKARKTAKPATKPAPTRSRAKKQPLEEDGAAAVCSAPSSCRDD